VADRSGTGARQANSPFHRYSVSLTCVAAGAGVIPPRLFNASE
jgi:hypothetical protein